MQRPVRITGRGAAFYDVVISYSIKTNFFRALFPAVSNS